MTSTLSISGASQSCPFGKGLSGDEAQRRLAEFGPNEPEPVQRASVVKQLLLLFANPLVIILLIASLVSAMIGDVVNASIIIVIVLLSSALNFTQTARSQRTAEQLRKEVAPVATVLRDGEWRLIPRREVVPGDLIQLVAGGLIPADARLMESRDLHVQQAALTGESLPVEKGANSTSQTAPDQSSMGATDTTASPDRMIRDFMLYIGPISSLYGFLTFYVLLKVFHASEQFFHTGWFVESLATQTLVIFVIRTAGNPLRSRPSAALTATTMLVALACGLLPFTPLASWLGFTPLPSAFFLFPIMATGTYLLLVEIFKRRLMKRLPV